MKKWQIVTSVVVALIAVLSLAVVAFAQTPQPPAGAPGTVQGVGRGLTSRGMHATNGAQAPMAGYGFHFGVNGGTLVDSTANVTGLSTSDVVAELQSGKTFAQIAQTHGKTAADLVNAVVADRKAVLDKAVADGRLTQDVADTLLATMKTDIEQHVNSTWSQIPFRGQPCGMGYRFNDQQPLGLGPRWSR